MTDPERYTIRQYDYDDAIYTDKDPDGQWIYDPDHKINLDRTNNKIENLKQLKKIADQKRSVVVPNSHAWEKPRPAVVLLHQQGSHLLQLFEMGMYIYEKEIKNGTRKPSIDKTE